MQSSPSNQGYKLPDVLFPPSTVCFQVEVPNDPAYIQAFIGAVYDTTLWLSWARDRDHTGTLAAQRMKKMWFDMLATQGNCSKITIPGSEGADTEMAIRQNPDNPCEIQSSQDGTNWCTFIDLSLCTNFGTQPGAGGAPPPTPGGGTQQTCKILPANGFLLLPTTVSTGDTILIQSASGAGNDPSDPSGAWRWREPNGDAFFGGIDIGLPVTDGSDPLPATNHMQLIANFNNGAAFVPLVIGTPATVPGGLTNVQVAIQVNDSSLADNNGSYQVCVLVTNNQAATWSHRFDFTVSPYSQFFSIPNLGNAPAAPEGIYVPGVGYKTNLCKFGTGQWYRAVKLNFTIPSEFIGDLAEFAFTLGGYGAFTDASYDIEVAGGAPLQSIIMPTAPVPPEAWAGSSTNHTYGQGIVSGAAIGTDPGGEVVWNALTLSGHGVDPFA